MNLQLDVLGTATVECGQEPLEGNYFVAAYPPFSCWNQPDVASLQRALSKHGNSAKKFGIYVHIPFCVERCAYCYYMSHDDKGGEIRPYLDALIERSLRLPRSSSDDA